MFNNYLMLTSSSSSSILGCWKKGGGIGGIGEIDAKKSLVALKSGRQIQP
jgi:hypothetical protein